MNSGEYKDIFLNEAREYLSNLNNSLVLLEKDATQTEAIREIFRAAHTLKGMSATMGYEPMVRLTHQMETVMEPIRSGAQSLSTRLVDVLFVCLDQLSKWIDTLASQDFIEEEGLEADLHLLETAAEEGKPLESSRTKPEESPELSSKSLSFAESDREVLAEARMNGFSILKVAVELSPDCVFKEVRAFMVLKCINELGEIVKSVPESEVIEKGGFSKGFILVVVTETTPEKLRESLLSVGEVSQVEVESLKPEEMSPAPDQGKSAGQPQGVPAPMTAGPPWLRVKKTSFCPLSGSIPPNSTSSWPLFRNWSFPRSASSRWPAPRLCRNYPTPFPN